MLQVFFHTERCEVWGGKNQWKTNAKMIPAHLESTTKKLWDSSYSHTLPVDGVSSFKFKWPGLPPPHIHTKGKRQAENTASFIVWLIQFEDTILYYYL